MTGMTERAKSLGDDAQDHDWLDTAVRVGMVAYGVVHLMIAFLAIQLAFGESEGSASSTGALQELSQQPFGQVMVWLVAFGMFLLVVWRLIEAAQARREKDGAKRLRKVGTSLLKAVIYGVIGWSALQVALGSGSSSGKKSGSDSMTAKIMDLPAGQAMVGAIGLAIIGYGIGMIVRGWTEKFAERLDTDGKSGDSGDAYILVGKIGYIAKGIAVGIVGGLFGYAAITHEANKSGGLDQALQEVLQQPFGPVLLTAIGAGIGCYGLFCFAAARHLAPSQT